jgi:hypothetical protein
MQQASRAGSAARGLSGSNAAVFDEGFRQYDLGRSLQTQRQGAAGAVLGLNQSQVDNPTLSLLNQYLSANLSASQNSNDTMGLLNSAGPSLFNPESALASSITAGNQANQAMFSSSTADKAMNATAPLNASMASY